MGAWGAGNFENDDALDFLAEVDGPAVLRSAFDALPVGEEREIEIPEACRALAAADIVAAMLGKPSDDCPPNLTARLTELGAPTGDLIEQARLAVSRILFDSELLDLWAESENCDDWNRTVTDLIERLNPEIPAKTKGRKPSPASSNAICPFCNDTVGDAPSLLLTVKFVEGDDRSGLEQMMECHLKCFNGTLHPRRLLQHWVYDPDDPTIQAEVDRILRDEQD